MKEVTFGHEERPGANGEETRCEDADRPDAAVRLRVTVLVPTFKRPDDLARCLDALFLQTRKPDGVIVVVRDSDGDTSQMLDGIGAAARGIRKVIVSAPGQVHALNAGLARIQTDVVAITDDDAAPHADWVQRIMEHFESRCDLGGVGGRDRMHYGGVLVTGRAAVVGKTPLIGKHIGNHHLGFGAPRFVHMLKGVNGAYRTRAIRGVGFDTRLHGTGAQVHWEISLGIALRRRGWKLLYDPAILVDHYLGERFDEDKRNTFNSLALTNMAYNETLVRMDQLSPFGSIVFLVWAIGVGTRVTPGLVQCVRFAPAEGSLAIAKLRSAIAGRLEAWKDARSTARQPSGS
ncbi:MAG: glycosyltransferase [Candidatus Velthaea sp.]|jgi:glycosyltransferase involved in cell wall biosynthesis